ncbi:MAG: hypothetical protein LUD39_00780, partial [Opitutae bacterium]|nr:hypothetical protein [Opitutae bacterium]
MELGLVARNGSVVAGNAGNALVGVDPKTFYSKDYGKLWEGTDETTDTLGKVEPRTLESPKFAFQNEDVNAERDVRTLERGDNELILSAVSDWLPGVKVSILGNEAFNRKLAEIQETQDNAIEDALLQKFSFVGGDWWMDDSSSYGRLGAQVRNRWTSTKETDEYYFDGIVFVCKKDETGVFGGFKVIDIFYQDEREKTTKEAEETERVNKDGEGADSSVSAIKREFEGDTDGDKRIRHGRKAKENGSVAMFAHREGDNLNGQRNSSRSAIYSPNGKLIAHRLTDEEADQKNGIIKRQIVEAVHGSRHDFPKFKLKYGGTGEGQQVVGKGLYFSSKEEVARFYAENTQEANVAGDITRKLFDLKKRGEISESDYEYICGIPMREILNAFKGGYFGTRLWDIDHEIRGTKSIINRVEDKYDRGVYNDATYDRLIDRLQKDLACLEREKESIPRIKEILLKLAKRKDIKKLIENTHHLYKVEFNDDTLLEWNTPLTEEQWDRVKKELNKRVDFSYGGKRLLERDVPPTPRELHSGYAKFVGKRGNYIGISDILKKAGFVGHKYPVDLFGGNRDYSKGTNYVIYDEDAITITDHIRWQIAEAANAIRYQRVYTGSGARWTAIPGNPLGGFDANFIGTGEGAQAYGWGFYATSKWGIAKAYAQANSGPS